MIILIIRYKTVYNIIMHLGNDEIRRSSLTFSTLVYIMKTISYLDLFTVIKMCIIYCGIVEVKLKVFFLLRT